jgi:hypothetical protein
MRPRRHQYACSPRVDAAETHDRAENEADRPRRDGIDEVTKSDDRTRSQALENAGRTLQDESPQAALARALDRLTAAGRLDLVERILKQIESKG